MLIRVVDHILFKKGQVVYMMLDQLTGPTPKLDVMRLTDIGTR